MKPAAFLALVCACFALAQPARGAIDVGLADNTMLGNTDGGASYLAIMNDVGMRELRMPVRWDPARPSRIEHEAQIRALLPVAAVRGVNVALSVQGTNAGAFTSAAVASGQFTAFVQKLAKTFPTVRDVIVGNEPNQPFFWQPQYDASARNVSGGGVRGSARGQLRRPEGGRSGDQRHRARALLARERRIRARPGTSPRHRWCFSKGSVRRTGRAAGRVR